MQSKLRFFKKWDIIHTAHQIHPSCEAGNCEVPEEL
ncbi:uncharacterized protein METZ01_LOCUS280930, partial [marine metagenome]